MAIALFLSVLVHFNFKFRVLLPSDAFSVYYPFISTFKNSTSTEHLFCSLLELQNTEWCLTITEHFFRQWYLHHLCKLHAHKWYHCYSLLNITKWQHSWKLLQLTRKIKTGLLHSRFQIYLTSFTHCWNSHNLSSFLTVSSQPILPVLH